MSNLFVYNGIEWVELGKDGKDAVLGDIKISDVKELPETIATPQLAPQKKVIFKSSGAENDLVVREGSGVALLQPDAGAYGSSYYIDIVFTQESTATSGGETSYVF